MQKLFGTLLANSVRCLSGQRIPAHVAMVPGADSTEPEPINKAIHSCSMVASGKNFFTVSILLSASDFGI